MRTSVIALCMLAVLLMAPMTASAQTPLNTGDVDCNRKINLSDITMLIDYVYLDGEQPCDFVSPTVAYSGPTGSETVTPPAEEWTPVLIVAVFVPEGGFVWLNSTGWFSAEDDHETRIGFSSDPATGIADLIWIIAENGQTNTLSHVVPVTAGVNYFHVSIWRSGEGELQFDKLNLVAAYFPAIFGG